MKKLIALTLSIALLVIMGVVPLSATESLTIDTITKSLVSDVYTFTVPFSASAGVEQVTLLATRGAGATAPTIIDNTTIVAIDQVALSAGKFEFSVDATKFDAVTYPNIYIKLGGTAIDAAVPNTPIVLAEAATTFTVVGYVDVPVAVGATVTLKDAQSAIVGTAVATDATGKFTFNGVTGGLTDIPYTVEITAKSALMRTIPITVKDANVDVSYEAKKIPLFFGETDNNAIIGFSDLVEISARYKKTIADTEFYDPKYDLNSDGVIGFADLVEVSANYKKTALSYSQWTKE